MKTAKAKIEKQKGDYWDEAIMECNKNFFDEQ